MKSDTQVQQAYKSARLGMLLVCWPAVFAPLLFWPAPSVYVMPAGIFLCETDQECEEMEEANPALFVEEKE